MHLDKVKNGAEYLLIRHNERAIKNYKNENIDSARTERNYNLTEQDGRSAMERFHDRLNQCSYKKQRNNVRMESIVITKPSDMRAVNSRMFFETVHKALQELTGGKENEVGAWVHMDESQAHMHYAFVPAIEIDGVLKLSAKNLMNRHKLQILHPEVQKAVDAAYGSHKWLIVADDPRDRQQTSDTLEVFKNKKAKLGELNSRLDEAETEMECNDYLYSMEFEKAVRHYYGDVAETIDELFQEVGMDAMDNDNITDDINADIDNFLAAEEAAERQKIFEAMEREADCLV